jgi:hypothetical protein
LPQSPAFDHRSAGGANQMLTRPVVIPELKEIARFLALLTQTEEVRKLLVLSLGLGEHGGLNEHR